MTTCLSIESHPFTTPVPSFILKPRGENLDNRAFKPRAASADLGRGLRIRSSFDEEDSSSGRRERAKSLDWTGVGVEAPEWAVRACGEARLEPVGSTSSTHDAIDLSTKACILIGRSPSCDLRLAEPTCSRKHALIFHHPNGSCYVVDCGSAHGTYVDGVKVESPAPAMRGEKAVATPHRVRRGALLRFGAPDGPAFVLRSFPASLEGLISGLAGEKAGSVGLPIVRADGGSSSPAIAPRTAEETPSFLPTLAPRPVKGSSSPASPTSALVALNTRLNALGGGANLTQSHLELAREAASKFVVPPTDQEQFDFCLRNNHHQSNKRFRDIHYQSDPIVCPESPIRLVKRFRSATFPLSPSPGCLKEPELVTPLVSQESLSTLEEDLRTSRRKVKFVDETENIYPASVTPEIQIGSFDEEHFASLQM